MSEELVVAEDFEEINRQMTEFDTLRDQIIKESRDITKFSKQAIYRWPHNSNCFIKHGREIWALSLGTNLTNNKQTNKNSLHRGKLAVAESQLNSAQQVIDKLLPLVQSNTNLRIGSFCGGLEEFAEASCFKYFLEHGSLMPYRAYPFLSWEEYIGGVCDFTGLYTCLFDSLIVELNLFFFFSFSTFKLSSFLCLPPNLHPNYRRNWTISSDMCNKAR